MLICLARLPDRVLPFSPISVAPPQRLTSHKVGCAVLVALLLALSLDAVHAKYGDRPGQLRDSAFSSLGRHGKKSSNDPRMWPDKCKKSKEETDKLNYHFVLPGTREAMKLHDSDVSLKALKRAKRSRSLSVRSRSSSVAGRSTSRKDSASVLAVKNREKLVAYLDLESHTQYSLMRILRLSHMRAQDLAPAGPWTAKSRPHSLLPDEQAKRRLILRKQEQSRNRKSKTLKGAALQAAKAAKAAGGKRSGSSKKRSTSVKKRSASVKPK